MNGSRLLTVMALSLAVISAGGPAVSKKKPGPSFNIAYEKYLLGNGLEVILHEDHSDPVVAVATLMHVGSSREKPGRTGFAHFFEHMSFNDSENVPRGANRKMIPELGGVRNGGTSSDFTVYYEVVPTDAFEKILWIASDRLGFMINTVTVDALEREKQVVKNEKRQRCDNAPYGFTDEVQRAALYPADHPYNWTVIGSLPDLQAATLEDVKEFYSRFYGANNATLVIAGDIDVARTKELVERWFGEIRRCSEVKDPERRQAILEGTRSLYHLDNFAKLPELQILYPAVPQYDTDSYALRILADILSGSKKAPLYKTIVEEKKLAPGVTTYLDASEIAGVFNIIVRANDGVDLDDVKAAIDASFALFEKEGVSEKEMARIKARNEIDLYEGMSTVLAKVFQLATYNEFVGDPGYVAIEAERFSSVTAEDVMDVYRRYIKGRPFVMTSFIPKDQPDLSVSGSEEARISREEIAPTAGNEQVTQGEEAECEKTPTKYDRSEPPLGDPPLLRSPKIWTEKLDNGMEVMGIEHTEVPLVNFCLVIKGGHWLDPEGKSGTANLLAGLMMEGTKNRTPAELEETLGVLGSTIEFVAGTEEILVKGNALSGNFEETMELFTEMILEPRWDAREFERLRVEQQTGLKDAESNPVAIAGTALVRLLYGKDHILGTTVIGTPATIEGITMEDLKAFSAANFSPAVSDFVIVGDVDSERVLKSLGRLEKKWKKKEVTFPSCTLPVPSGPRVFFIDVPGASQSQIIVSRLALSGKDEDFNNLDYANRVLGGGSSSRLFQLLRLEKGFTYGANSFLARRIGKSPFIVQTSVRTNATEESLQLIRDLLRNYRATFTDREMEITKNMVIKGNTRAFEALNTMIGLLTRISEFDLPMDFLERNQQELLGMNLGDFHRMIEEHLDEGKMVYLVVGDAATQLPAAEALGCGPVVMLDIYGNPIE